MQHLNPNKANDIYQIKPAILRSITPALSPVITNMFNEAITENCYPDALKITKIIAAYKKKDPSLPENYRPISLLPIIAKILDKIINDQLMTHLLTHNILSPRQYAFRPHSSTTLALQTTLDKIHEHINNKQPTLAIFLDLSKAYDTVSHSKLLHKLRHDFNFTDDTITFFTSFFTNRTQETHTEHAQSPPQKITHGIPQGSTLSTTLFILYTNDICKSTKHADTYIYADDTTLIITAANTTLLQEYAQHELDNIVHYFHTNNLVPNASKTTYTTFYPHSHPDINLSFNNIPLKHEAATKLLGVHIQNTLKFDIHIAHIIQKLQPQIHTLRYINKVLPQNTLIRYYYSHIYPHLLYAITIWGNNNTSKQYLQPLHRTHKKIIRIIFKQSHRAHTTPLMHQHNILNIYNIYTLQTAMETHTFIHPQKKLNRPHNNHNYIKTWDIHKHATRFSIHQSLHIPNPLNYSQTKQNKYTLEHSTHIASHIWNSLPATLRKETTRNIFKKNLKKYLLNNQI